MIWFNLLLALHIASGMVALIAGTAATLFKKGSPRHKKMGNVFFWSMGISAVTSIVLSTVRFSPFLLSIGLFTLYLIIGGKIVWAIREKAALEKWWSICGYAGLGISAVKFSIASLLLKTNPFAAIILYVFGGILLLMSIADIRNKSIASSQQRILQHISKMGAGFIATITAFIAVNFTFLPPYVGWLAPTAIGSVLIAAAIRKQRKAFGDL
jgi:uncharacterized membrane protein